MNLGLLLPLGDSLKNFSAHGQDARFVRYYLRHYCRHFEKVFLFSYENESYPELPKNCFLVCPEYKIHRYLYSLVLPFIHRQEYTQCDVFRCFHPSAALPAIVGKLFFGRKFVFNYNYDYLEWARVEDKSFLVPFLFVQQWLAFKFCDGVFVADENMEKYVRKFAPSRKITIVRNGVDTTAFKPLPRRKDKKEKIVLSVGRLEIQKNYELLIQAVALLDHKLKLLIVGRGSQKQKLEALARDLEVKLEIIEVIPHSRLPEMYNSADVYVQPSLMEAPVKTLLEAMSCGLPCVATDVVGIKDVIQNGENGLLAKLDADDLKVKIEKLLIDRFLANKFSVAARKTVIEKYDLDRFLQLETEILKSI